MEPGGARGAAKTGPKEAGGAPDQRSVFRLRVEVLAVGIPVEGGAWFATGYVPDTLPQHKSHRNFSMLEVHPPHQAAHNWRDFFVHIATIALGLLIVVGLEQMVERIHEL
jgi:hypothetical protein